MPLPQTKSSEFARLFELFDQLASRRTRTHGSTSSALDDLRSVPIPDDLEPVFRNLITLIDARNRLDREKPASRGRRNTVSTTKALVDSDSENETTTEFPAGGKQYPFTFKMMLHKLYDLEEWGKKVQDVLEKSQNDFKSLADKEDVSDVGRKGEETVGHPRGESRVHLSPAVDAGPTTTKGRPRSHTVATTAPERRAKEIEGATKNRPFTQEDKKAAQANVRAVKKRCVGRRKSITGAGLGSKREWFYNAAVASSETYEGHGTPQKCGGRLGAPDGVEDRPVVARRRLLSVATDSPWCREFGDVMGARR
ncbi:hypothetical protein Moror_11659 [Moniliophthora roreri MCA 2997]|uniref:Uncharacterized protein n=2 Tax=Moniliophthora roreri TaxID=221103 RepID=V2Y6T2_MONRO|nr:hypothetical protein Moror_11659 [Moniliophthora roreri MCA 2997]